MSFIQNPHRFSRTIGLLSKPDHANTSQWTESGTISAVYNSDYINISNGSYPALTNYITYNNYTTDCENYIVRGTMKANILNGTSYGCGFVAYGQATSGLVHCWVGCFPGNLGQVFIQINSSLVTSYPALSVFNQGDILDYTLQCAANVFTFTVTNRAGGAPVSVTTTENNTFNYDYPFSYILPSATRFGFVNFGGDYDVSLTDIVTTDLINADLMHLADSKGGGYFAGGTTPANRVSNLWQAANPTKIIYNNSGCNETTNHFKLKYAEYSKYRPKKILIWAPSNDPRNFIATGTSQTNLSDIRTFLLSIGVDVWCRNPLTENLGGGGIDQSGLITAIANVFPSNRIIPEPPTWDAINDNEADGIHPKSTAQSKIYLNDISYITV